MIHPNFHAREQERQALQREREEREQEERERLEKASRRLARFIFEEDPSAEAPAEAPAQAETTPEPTPSADAGAHGMEPQKRESPAEQLAGILLYNQGVPTEPWR